MHDHRRSNITIENASARTAVCALGERFLGDSIALRALLARSPRVDFDELATGAFSLVADQRNELPPRGIMNGLRKHPACEAFDVEIFDRDATEAIDDCTTLLVQEVAAGAGDVRLMRCDGELALAADVRASLAPSERTLKATKLALGALREVRAIDSLAVAERDEAAQADVDADALGAGTLDGCDLDVKDDVPFARVAAEDAGLRLTRKLPMPPHADLAGNADEAQFARFADRHSVADAEVCGVISVASPETRKASRSAALYATEERLVGFIQLAEHLLLSGRGPAPLVRQVATDLGECHDLLVTLDRDAVLVRVDAVFESGVVKLTEIAKHLRQRSRLRPVGFDAVAIAQQHGLFALLIFDVLADSCFGDVPDRASEIGPAPQRRKARTQVREFLAQEPGCRPLEAIDDLGNGTRRIALDKDVNVIWHHLDLVQKKAVLGRDLAEQLLEPIINGRRQNGAPVLRAPDDVILEAEDRSSVFCVPISHHAQQYTCVAHITQAQTSGRAPIHPPAKAGGPLGAELMARVWWLFVAFASILSSQRTSCPRRPNASSGRLLRPFSVAQCLAYSEMSCPGVENPNDAI